MLDKINIDMRFQYNFCEAAHNNMFGYGVTYKCGNFTACDSGKVVHNEIIMFKAE